MKPQTHRTSPTPTTFDEVQKVFAHESAKMIQAFNDFPWENEEAYAHWLAQSFYMVQHTTTYLCLTAGGMCIDYPKYHSFLLHHLREETNHEVLALNDQKNLGWDLSRTPETFETQMMVQSQYYFIRKTPFAHFSFFWLLETMAAKAGPAVVERLSKKYKRNSITFLKLHAMEDVGHSQEIAEAVAGFPEHVLQDILLNLKQTGFLYSEMLKGIAVRATSLKEHVA